MSTSVADVSGVEAPAAEPRFGQMIFTSVEGRPGAPGGWQVMHADDLSAAEIELLRGRVAATFDWPGPVADAPTEAEREALPRRLVHGAAGDEAMAYWHTAPAGTDARGRPISVFAHVVLDRGPGDQPEPLRPADVARTVEWLRPLGQPEVQAARLPVLAPRAAPDRFDELAFLQHLTERGGLLAVLLDGVLAAMSGGPPVVLGLADPAEAISWIDAIGRLMSAGTARALRWSTLERAETVAGTDAHLAIVPRADLAALPATVVALDELTSPSQGDLGGTPHRATNGAEVAVTPWSGMVIGILSDPAAAREVIAAQDVVAAEVGDADLHPAWPMAVAITSLSQPVPDADDEARALAESELPASRPPAVLEKVADRLLASRLGATTEDAWEGLRGLTDHHSAGLHAIAVRIYLARAMEDDDWLLRPTGTPVPAVPDEPYEPDSALTSIVVDRLLRTIKEDGTAADGVRSAAVAVRLADFLHRSGLLNLSPGRRDELVDVAQALLEIVLPGTLPDPVGGPAMIDTVGAVTSEVRQELLVPIARGIAANSSRPLGRRLPREVLAWLYSEEPTVPSAAALAAARVVDPLLAEVAAQATAIVSDPSALRLTALWAALTNPHPTSARIAHLAAGPPLPSADLVAVVSRFGPRGLAEFLVPALLSNPWGEDLLALVKSVRSAGQELTAGPADRLTPAAADLRAGGATLWQSREDERRGGRSADLVELAQRLLEANRRDLPLAVDLWWSLVAAQVVDTIYRPVPERPRPELDRLIAREGMNGGVPQETENVLWNLLENGAIFDVDVVMAALHAGPESLPGEASSRLHSLARLTIKGDVPLLDAVVRSRVRLGRFDVGDMRWTTRRRIRDAIRTEVADRDAEEWVAAHEAFAEQWWASIVPEPPAQADREPDEDR